MKPTPEQLYIAVQWLRYNEGENGEEDKAKEKGIGKCDK